MKNVVYLSDISPQFDPDMLGDILSTARNNNGQNEITGLLLYGSGHFIQYIEGPDTKIDALLKTISKDERHRNMKILAERSLDARLFPNWWMGLLNMEEKILFSKKYNEIVAMKFNDSAESNTFKNSVMELFESFCQATNLTLSEPLQTQQNNK